MIELSVVELNILHLKSNTSTSYSIFPLEYDRNRYIWIIVHLKCNIRSLRKKRSYNRMVYTTEYSQFNSCLMLSDLVVRVVSKSLVSVHCRANVGEKCALVKFFFSIHFCRKLTHTKFELSRKYRMLVDKSYSHRLLWI